MRAVDEWVGKTDDTPIPPRVQRRIFERCEGRCHRCTRTINAQAGEWWMIEHEIAIANGGQNRESNCCLTCEFCKPAKDADDAAIKKKGTAIAYRALGIKPTTKPKGRGFQTNRDGQFKKRMDGTVVPRERKR